MKSKIKKFICCIPIIVTIVAILEYYLLNNAYDYKNTQIYPIFLIVTLCIFYIRSYFAQTLFFSSPFYSLIIIILTIYDYFAAKTFLLTYPYFPNIDQIFNAMIDDRNYLMECVIQSLKLLFTGYIYSVIIGIITGIACGYSAAVNYWISPFMKLLGTIPSVTWLPLIMILSPSLFFGSVFIIGLGVWFTVTMATIVGIKNIDQSYFEVAKTLGASNLQLIAKVAVPFALPNIFQGLIQGMSVACMGLIIAEMIGVESGLGWYITWQSSWAAYDKMYGAIILICITFVIVNNILTRIRDYLLFWQKGLY